MIEREISFAYTPYTLHFKKPGGTSRGILKDKLTYLVKAELKSDPGCVAYGEVPIFPGLSKESVSELESALFELVHTGDYVSILERHGLSSLRFGIEQILNSLSNGNGLIFPSLFTSGHNPITINGLVWMGEFSKMKERVIEKLNAGFSCIKIKIAAINWEEELSLIRFIRGKVGNEVIIRVDANGGFRPDECLKKLEALSKFGIHSVEQPIQSGNYVDMRKLCAESPVPIALDEELIGVPPGDGREEMLEFIRPRYLILKPAFCYGFSGATDWISRAEKLNIGYWITSALESSVGLNAIAQFTGSLNPVIPQGLGTGNLFTNNFHSPLLLKNENLFYRPGDNQFYCSQLNSLEWKTAN